VTVAESRPDRAALDDAIAWCNGRLRMHGGGIELVSIDHEPDGAVVHVRFAGMCTACAWKTLTWFGTVKDAIEAVPGVARVEAPGTRVSEQAEARFRAMNATHTLR
jgi:Fe-S cluster biogenesis protein NfuA